MNKKVFKNHTMFEIIYNFYINISYIIIPIITGIISFFIMKKMIIDQTVINDISNAFITVSGILPGILLTFITNVTSLPEDNFLIKNIKKQGYFGLLYKIIFLDISLWVITLIFSVIMLILNKIILLKITISLFVSAVALFIHGFVMLSKITLLTNR